jgi:AcrR family transcriptional regulator
LTGRRFEIILIIDSMSIKSKKPTTKGRPSPRNREAQKRETWRRILDAAIRVFSRDGILAATTAAVAAEAGVAHGSVFVHFESKEGLIVASIQDFGEAVSLRLHELARAGARTREVLGAHLEAIREREDFYARLVVEAPLLPDEARTSLVLIQSAISFHLSPAFEADRAAGRIKAMSLHLLFNTWLGLVHYYLANGELFAPGASVIERRGSELLGHFMSLISKGG